MEIETRFSCESCSKTFKYKQDLAVHIKSQHAESDVKARFSCEVCPKTFHLKKLLTRHFKSKHTEGTGGKAKFICEICPKTYEYKDGLTKHIKSEHFKCKWCDYQTQSKDEDINRHHWNAHHEKVVQGEIDEINWANGFKTKSRGPHICDHCRGTTGNRLCTYSEEGDCCVLYWEHKLKTRNSYPNQGIYDGYTLIICWCCYMQITYNSQTCKKINSVTGNMLYNISEMPRKRRKMPLYKVAFYNNNITIREDLKPCRLCGESVGDFIEEIRWGQAHLLLKHRYVLCPALREPRKRIFDNLSSLLMEKDTKPLLPYPRFSQWANAEASTRTKSLDRTTVNALFSDEDTLTTFIISPTFQTLPNAYRFKTFDPKVRRIEALKKETFLSCGESF